MSHLNKKGEKRYIVSKNTWMDTNKPRVWAESNCSFSL